MKGKILCDVFSLYYSILQDLPASIWPLHGLQKNPSPPVIYKL